MPHFSLDGRRAELVNCWEYNNCAKEVFTTCPAYPDSGSRCWMLAGVKCQDGEKEFSSLDEQIACCSKCDFYNHESARDRLKPATNRAGSRSRRHMKKMSVSGRPDIA